MLLNHEQLLIYVSFCLRINKLIDSSQFHLNLIVLEHQAFKVVALRGFILLLRLIRYSSLG